jgi:hypothetical protein
LVKPSRAAYHGQCPNGGYGCLEVKCRRREIRASQMDVIRHLQYAGLEVGNRSNKKGGTEVAVRQQSYVFPPGRAHVVVRRLRVKCSSIQPLPFASARPTEQRAVRGWSQQRKYCTWVTECKRVMCPWRQAFRDQMPAVRVDGCIAFLKQDWGGVNPKCPRQVNARRKASSSTQIQFMVRRTTCQKRAICPAASVKVCGCRPHDGGAARTGAGVRKPPMEETAGGVVR